MNNHLRDHRIIVRAYRASGINCALDAYPVAARKMNKRYIPGTRSEASRGVFRIDPAFNGMPVQMNVTLLVPEGQACGDPDLFPDQVHACHLLCHRMLHLNPRIHFDEIKMIFPVKNKFHGSRAHVMNGSGGLERCLVNCFPLSGIQNPCRTFLHQFLIPPLHGAVPLTKLNNIALCITQNLHLNVMRMQNEFFKIQRSVSEGSSCFRLRTFKGVPDFRLVKGGPHSSSSASCRSLDKHRIPDFLRDLRRFLPVFQNPV